MGCCILLMHTLMRRNCEVFANNIVCALSLFIKKNCVSVPADVRVCVCVCVCAVYTYLDSATATPSLTFFICAGIADFCVLIDADDAGAADIVFCVNMDIDDADAAGISWMVRM